ncbi:MAG: PQQ-dependent sugar dehydrogenase, partial [Acidimicrobiales bacterium]
MRRGLAMAMAVGVLASCSGGDGDPPAAREDAAATTTTTTVAAAETTTTAAPASGTLGTVELATVEVGELDQPIALAPRPGSPDLYIAEKGGRVRLIKTTTNPTTDAITYQVQRTPLLDLSGDVINEGERGLLGMAFSSDGRKLYLNYTRQPDGHTMVVEYALGDGATIDRGSRRELLMVEQPFANHNGGQLVVGPDGFLYVGLGDGGSGGDPQGNGQNPETLLGSILRIDPEGGGGEGP